MTSKTKEVTCNQCGAKFADILYLKAHQSIAHAPDRPEEPTATSGIGSDG